MIRRRSLVLGLLCMAVALSASPQPGRNGAGLDVFQGALAKEGFDAHAAPITFVDLAKEYCAGNMASAQFMNLDAPYLAVRPWKSAEELQTESQLAIGTPPIPPASEAFRLRPDEAIVLIGLTPPPAKYFSYTPYLMRKAYPQGIAKSFSSLGDSVNLRTIHAPGTPFNQPIVLIFTPDRGTDARVRHALQVAGYPVSIIHTVVIPSSMLNLGLGAGADTLVIAQRIAQWQDPAAGASYLAHPSLTGFRVTPRASATPDPFPVPPLRVRGTGRTEMDLMNKLGELRAGIIEANPALSATEYVARPVAYDGYDYIQRAADPFGDTRDTLYLAAGYFPPLGWTDAMTLADDEFLIVYGPNHVATGKVTYVNINAYSSVKGQLALGSVYDDQLFGTAAPYLQPGDPAADLMYVYKLAKDCHGESNCLSLSTGGCPRLPALGDADPLMVVIRSYLEPSTRVGPAYTEMLYDRVIKFSPRR